MVVNYKQLWSLQFVLLVLICYTHENPIQIEVFYESYCPASRDFLYGQLGPAFKKIPQLMNVTLVPYGNVEIKTKDGKEVLQCQHGSYECKANAIQGCALELYPISQAVPFIACCCNTNSDPLKEAPKCAATNGMNWTQLAGCSKSSVGGKIVQKMKSATEAANIFYLPWIEINGKHDPKGENSARENLFKYISESNTANKSKKTCVQ